MAESLLEAFKQLEESSEQTMIKLAEWTERDQTTIGVAEFAEETTIKLAELSEHNAADITAPTKEFVDQPKDITTNDVDLLGNMVEEAIKT